MAAATKRKRTDDNSEMEDATTHERMDASDDEVSISPPPLKRMLAADKNTNDASPTVIRSPFQLTSIGDLPQSRNQDCVTLHDLLGDPLIREAWLFDFLFDVDFVMAHFDEDVRKSIAVKIVHGSWKQEDTNRLRIMDGIKRWPNVEAVPAYLPDPFGTHHSKMMVLFRHDDTAEVVIHTANMIERDWANFTQAVWRSPRLPRSEAAEDTSDQAESAQLGSGLRFKHDLLRYLASYSAKRTGPLSEQLKALDFSDIKAVFIASTPSKQNARESSSESHTAWGWVGLRDILQRGPHHDSTQKPLIVAQVSSVGTLSDDWIGNMENVLATPRTMVLPKADFRLIFPTDDEVRRSLDGYAAGSSIHMKTQSVRQQKMLVRLRPHLTHWAGDALDEAEPSSLPTTVKQAGRRRAAPHIKTFMRFTNSKMDNIEWAMMTSANFSTQAWGDVGKKGDVRISSYETGVVVWPALFATADQKSKMVPAFQKDLPDVDSAEELVVGLRMPYDVPLVRYKPEEMPWVATTNYTQPDWTGATYMGYDPT